MKKTVFTIEQKMPGTGSIHDIASDRYDRDIVFAPGCRYAVVFAGYYGGNIYTTHRTPLAAIKKSNRLAGKWSHKIIDTVGNEYLTDGFHLVKATF
jgi:hypothetical protein